MNERVAILLPIYKGDSLDFFKLSLDSIFCQTYQSYKVFVGVDGPVPSATDSYLREVDKKHKVEVCWFPENRGLACVLNDLIAKAHEEQFVYLARMDADDMMMPSRLDIQLDFLLQHPDVDVVGGGITEIDEYNMEVGKVIVYPKSHEECVNFFAIRNPLAHPAVMFRYRYFEKMQGGYRADHPKNQDTMLWLDGLTHGCKMANVPDIVLKFRVTNDFFRKRRNGWSLAKHQLADRLEVNRGLLYGVKSYLYAYAAFFIQIAPVWIKKFCYQTFR